MPYACLALLLLIGVASWFTKLRDLDFWWHIKTGQYILDERGLPGRDPFTFTSIERDEDMPERPGVILKSYWLSQIIFFLIYSSAGPLGIILFKSAVFAVILVLLWRHLFDNGTSPLLMAIMLAGFVIASREYAAERPQIFSFLFAAIVLGLLEKTRKPQREVGAKSRVEAQKNQNLRLNPNLFFLPFLMLLWANMHGGYLVGMVFILIYAIGLFRRAEAGPPRLQALAVYAVSLALTFLNPVTYHQITSFVSFQGSILERETAEFAPLFRLIRAQDVAVYPLLALMAASVVIIAVHVRALLPAARSHARDADPFSLPFEHLVLLSGTLVASIRSVRYGMFFMIVAVPVVTQFLSRRISLPLSGGIKKGLFAGIAAVLFLFFLRSPFLEEARGPLIDQIVIPVNAAEFIRQRTPEPNLYNDINWGGYLTWRLYPGYRVFSDTRTLNPEIYRQYLSILTANERTFFGKPEWKALLDTYSVRTIVHSAVNPYSGEVYPLMGELLKDEMWHLVYFDGVAAILTKDLSPGLAAFPKELLLQEIRLEALRGLGRNPNHPGFLKTLGMVNTPR